MKNEMYYRQEKSYPSFEAFGKAVEEYIRYYNNERIQAKNKMDAPGKIPESIHVSQLSHHSMCPGFWVHIRMQALYLFSD